MVVLKESNQITFTEQKKIIEIKEWYLKSSENIGIKIEDNTWYDKPPMLDENDKYLWNYEEIIYSIGDSESSVPAIIGVYGTGAGINNIENFYTITSDLDLPTGALNEDGSVNLNNTEIWKSSLDPDYKLDPVNKYLWNCERISYSGTIKEPTITNPVIIGVYGDSGVTFDIYSAEGFQFKEGVKTITLRVSAFEGVTPVQWTSLQWSYKNISDEDIEENYTILESEEDGTLTVDADDEYALANLRCVMTYGKEKHTYKGYVTLTSEIEIYSSAIKMLAETNNILGSNDEYMIAYVSVYKNNQEIDKLITEKIEVYSLNITTLTDDNNTTLQVFSKDIGDVEDQEYAYFINKEDNYKIILAQYSSALKQWVIVDDHNYDYIYSFDNVMVTSSNTSSKIVFVKKNDIDKRMAINFTVFTPDENILTTTSIAVLDLNDPIMSISPPKDPKIGQLWVDMYTTPYTLKVYISEEEGWVQSNYQSGGIVYTSKPQEYHIGDLWVLAEDETYQTVDENGDIVSIFKAGSMLKSRVDYIQKKYLSKPTSYKMGDLWQLAENETYLEFTSGTVLMATVDSIDTEVPEEYRWTSEINDLSDTYVYNQSHWIDAMSNVTDVITNVQEYLDWTSSDGLKIHQKAKRNNEDIYPFYVQLTSTKMGFHNVEYNEITNDESDIEVVHIGNQSARILDATLTGKYDDDGYIQGKTTINQNIDLYGEINLYQGPYQVKTTEDEVWEPKNDLASTGFQLKIEDDGSLSLVHLE